MQAIQSSIRLATLRRGQRHATHIGHVQVRNQRIKIGLHPKLAGLHAIVSLNDLDTVLFEQQRDHATTEKIIIDQKNPQR